MSFAIAAPPSYGPLFLSRRAGILQIGVEDMAMACPGDRFDHCGGRGDIARWGHFLIVATEGVSVGVAAGPWIASTMLLVFGIGVIWGGARVWSDHT